MCSWSYFQNELQAEEVFAILETGEYLLFNVKEKKGLGSYVVLQQEIAPRFLLLATDLFFKPLTILAQFNISLPLVVHLPFWMIQLLDLLLSFL